MSTPHPALKETTLHGHPLSNRFALAPMTRVSADADGTPTDLMVQYYQSFAAGGFPLLITEGTYTDPISAQAYPHQPGLVTDRHQQGWKKITHAVHATGGRIILQLMHGGALSQHLPVPVSASSIQPLGKMLAGYSPQQGPYLVPRALSLSEIDAIIKGFADTARRAEQAGFDGIEVHGANGYLLDQFLTAETNHRTDQYGGSLENRARLIKDIIQAIKTQVHADFIVGVRLSQAKVNDHDYFWPNGVEDATIIFTTVAAAGADYIHFASESKGFHYNSYTQDGVSLPKLARTLTGLSIIANGGLQDPEISQNVIEEGHADLIAIGKTALLNPDLPGKLKQGQDVIPFTFDVFKYGVTLADQTRWQEDSVS